MKDKQLAEELRAFLNRSKWVERTQVHRIIKEFYVKRGNWKGCPRGNPSKGYEKQQEMIAKNVD